MKSCPRIGFYLLVLGLGLLWSGCATQSRSTSNLRTTAHDFEIVETATKRELTSKEMTQLRAMVGEYLAKEGIKEAGDYFVKIYLASEQAGAPEEWVVVRYTQPAAYTATRFSLLSSDPYYNGYSPYYSYDYYPFSTFGFSRFSLQYYDDPFGYYGYHNSYIPRRTYTGYHGREGDRDGRGDKDHKPDNRPHHPGPVVNGTPVGSTPRQRNPQWVAQTNRWDANRSDNTGTRTYHDRKLINPNDPTQPWNRRTATPADYTPAYVAPVAGSNPDRQVRTAPNPGEAGASRHDRSRRDYSGPNNRDSTYRNRDSGPNRSNVTSSSQPPTYSRPAQAPTYTPPAPRSEPRTRSEPPARSDPPARYQAPQPSSPPAPQSDNSSRSESTSRSNSRRDIHADDRSGN